MSKILEEVLAANARYAESFGDKGELGLPPARKFAMSSQRFTTDCEVCCRPFEVVVECEPGEILSLDVQGN